MKPGNVRCMDCRCSDGSTCPGESPAYQAQWREQMDRELGGPASHARPADRDIAAEFRIKHRLVKMTPFKSSRSSA